MVGLKLGGYRLTIASVSSSIPTILLDRTCFGLKMLWVGWCPYFSTVVPAWSQEVVSLDFISAMQLVTA